MGLNWYDKAWEDYLYWQSQDKKTLNKINRLLKDMRRDPFVGIGKPELLSGDLAGLYLHYLPQENEIWQ